MSNEGKKKYKKTEGIEDDTEKLVCKQEECISNIDTNYNTVVPLLFALFYGIKSNKTLEDNKKEVKMLQNCCIKDIRLIIMLCLQGIHNKIHNGTNDHTGILHLHITAYINIYRLYTCLLMHNMTSKSSSNHMTCGKFNKNEDVNEMQRKISTLVYQLFVLNHYYKNTKQVFVNLEYHLQKKLQYKSQTIADSKYRKQTEQNSYAEHIGSKKVKVEINYNRNAEIMLNNMTENIILTADNEDTKYVSTESDGNIVNSVKMLENIYNSKESKEDEVEQNIQMTQEKESLSEKDYNMEIEEENNNEFDLNKNSTQEDHDIGSKNEENVIVLDCSSEISESSVVETNDHLCNDLKYLINKKTKNYKDLKMFLYFQFKKHVIQKLYTYKIYRSDLKVLTPNKWLNDKIINSYLKMLYCNNNKFYLLTTYFYPQLVKRGYNSVKSWTRNINLFAYKYIIIPVFVPGHWMLAVVDTENYDVTVYDSLHNSRDYVANNIKQWIQNEYYKMHNKVQEFACYVPKNIPKQQNGDDCGVFVIYFAKKYCEGKEICHNTPQIVNTYILRVQIMHEICVGKILYKSDEKIHKK
ncbi:SUMO1 sentrin specific peptidase 1 [Binucleata daphniae]